MNPSILVQRYLPRFHIVHVEQTKTLASVLTRPVSSLLEVMSECGSERVDCLCVDYLCATFVPAVDCCVREVMFANIYFASTASEGKGIISSSRVTLNFRQLGVADVIKGLERLISSPLSVTSSSSR